MGTIQSLERGLRVLEATASMGGSATLSEIARKTSLPRSTAQGLMNTVNVAADYLLAPAPRVNIRAFFRNYSLNNDTPSSRWQYVTSDTTSLTGTVSYVNKRVSLPYAWDRQNAGADATWRLPARTTFTFGYEREAIGREFREADTTEDVLRATLRTRATRWLSVQGRVLQGLRDGGEYNNNVTHEGYWYAPSDANDFNNPLLTFDNHPDMRRFDVSDRQRRQFDVTLNLTPRDVVAISSYIRYRNDDFDSDVTSSQPLLGTGLADEAARTRLFEDALLVGVVPLGARIGRGKERLYVEAQPVPGADIVLEAVEVLVGEAHHLVGNGADTRLDRPAQRPFVGLRRCPLADGASIKEHGPLSVRGVFHLGVTAEVAGVVVCGLQQGGEGEVVR